MHGTNECITQDTFSVDDTSSEPKKPDPGRHLSTFYSRGLTWKNGKVENRESPSVDISNTSHTTSITQILIRLTHIKWHVACICSTEFHPHRPSDDSHSRRRTLHTRQFVKVRRSSECQVRMEKKTKWRHVICAYHVELCRMAKSCGRRFSVP